MDRQARLLAMQDEISQLPDWKLEIVAHVLACARSGRPVHPAWIASLAAPEADPDALDLEMMDEEDDDELVGHDEARRLAGLR